MNLLTISLYFLIYLFDPVFGQRVAPGVPPQQYQQVPQMQQVPVQHVQMQQQQVPVQQMQMQQMQMQQIPQQQVPQMQMQHVNMQPVQAQQQIPVQMQQQVPVQMVHQGHHIDPNQILNAANIAHEKDHIQEHLEVPMDTSKMTEQELQFHYFKMHDADNNNRLDGCELIKSLIHWHGELNVKPNPDEKVKSDEELAETVDFALESVDLNGDGFIDYSEYISTNPTPSPKKT